MGTATDLVVIGGGPAGVSAALRARELGAVAMSPARRALGRTDQADWEHHARA